MGHDGRRRHVVRRALVRRDPRHLLPQGPGREGRRRAADHLGRAQGLRQGLQDQAGAKWGIYLQPGGTGPGRRSCRSPGRTAPSSTTARSSPWTRPRWPRRWSSTQSSSTTKLSQRPPLQPGAIEQSFVNGKIGVVLLRTVAHGPAPRPGRPSSTASRTSPPMPKEQAGTSFVGGGNLAVFKDAKNRDGGLEVRRVPEPARGPAEVVRHGQRPAGGQERLGDAAASPTTRMLATFGTQLEDAKAPPADRHVGAGRSRRSTRDREGRQGRPARPTDAVKAIQSQADVHRHREPDDGRRARRRARSRPRRGPQRVSPPARRRHALAGLGVRPAVPGAVRGLHRRPGAGVAGDELHRPHQPRHLRDPLAVDLVGLRELRRAASGRPVPARGAVNTGVLRRRRHAADHGAGRPGRGGRPQLGHHAVPDVLPGRASTCPVVTSIVAVAVVWRFLLQPDRACSTRLLGWVGIDGPNWLAEHHVGDAVADRHGRLAEHGHADGDLPGRAADHPQGPARGRVARRRRALAAVPAHHPAPAAADPAVRRRCSPASATCSSSRSRS